MQQRALTAWSPKAASRSLKAEGRNAVALVVVLTLGLLVVAGVAAAQASVDGTSEPLGGADPPAQTQRDINALYNLIFPISIVIGILVEALLLYAIIRYRGRGKKAVDSGEHERGHTKLEIAWTIPPAVILLIVGLLSAQTLGAIEEGPPRDFTVRVIASQFSWTFQYPDNKTSPTLEVEAEKVVNLEVVSTDVIHSFSVPSLGVKIDAVPGRVNLYWLKADQPGEYQVQCMEYCGSHHAYMRAKVTAVPKGSTAQGWVPPGAGAACAEGATDQAVRFLEQAARGKTWSVDPFEMSLRTGTDYCFDVINPAGQATVHNMEVIDASGAKVATMAPRTLQPGESAELPAKFEAAGTFTYYCAVPGHRAIGMEGTITVA